MKIDGLDDGVLHELQDMVRRRDFMMMQFLRDMADPDRKVSSTLEWSASVFDAANIGDLAERVLEVLTDSKSKATPTTVLAYYLKRLLARTSHDGGGSPIHQASARYELMSLSWIVNLLEANAKLQEGEA